MRYGEIARKIRQETKSLSETTSRLNALADELERIDSATPAENQFRILGKGKCSLQSVKQRRHWDYLAQPYTR